MKVELIDFYGGDIAAARAAWTSTMGDVQTKTPEQIRKLIVDTLWNNESGKAHKTPFERPLVEFNITCDQASHIHLLKHRMALINGESARYKELKDDRIYLPKDWENIHSEEEKYLVINPNNGETIYETSWINILEVYSKLGNDLYHQALKDLEPVLGRKRAKESARFFKTMNSEITLSVAMNMSCFANFYALRSDIAAQLEIRMIAEEMFSIIKKIPEFEFIIEAFELERYNREANNIKIEFANEVLSKVPEDVLISLGIDIPVINNPNNFNF